MNLRMRRAAAVSAVLAVVLAFGAVTPSGASGPPAPHSHDRAYYVLPPGNYGGLPTTAQSLDQLPLYDALTPLRGNVTDADIARDYLPENFQPVGASHV